MSVRPQLRRPLVCAALVLMRLAPATAAAEDYFFVTVYGCQRPYLNLPRYTHTWATLAHFSGAGPELRTCRGETFTISWLSADLTVDPKKLTPQPGKNLTLQETLDWCDRNRTEVGQFGPYQIQPKLYALMWRRWQQLESGHVYYRASDLLNLKRDGDDEVCNCIYSVLDYDGRDPAIRPVTLGFGWKASAFVARELERYMIHPEQTYPWVSERLGVKNYPTYRIGLAALLGNFPDGR